MTSTRRFGMRSIVCARSMAAWAVVAGMSELCVR